MMFSTVMCIAVVAEWVWNRLCELAICLLILAVLAGIFYGVACIIVNAV